MSLADDKPALYAVEGGVLSLSGPALQEFLRAVLDRGVPFRFSAHGMSMDPFIRDGDVITIVPLASRQPRVGDVVAFCRPPDGRLVVHRVVCAGPFGLIVRGDANDTADGVVAFRGVLGRVSVVQRRSRRVVIGSGPERLLLAHLSRRGMLRPLVLHTRRVVHRVRAALLRTRSTRGGETRA